MFFCLIATVVAIDLIVAVDIYIVYLHGHYVRQN